MKIGVTTLRKFYGRTLAALGIAALSVSSLPSLAEAVPSGSQPVVVSMGDSYMAGTAGRWAGNSNTPTGNRDGSDRGGGGSSAGFKVYGPTYQKCYQSDVSEINSSSIPGRLPVNLACNGAVTKNVWRAQSGGQGMFGAAPQADQLLQVAQTKRVDMVVLSIGGNDLGFADIVEACIKSYMNPLGRSCHAEQQAKAENAMAGAMSRVDKSVKEIRAVMTQAGYTDSSYRLVLQSYPSVFPRSSEMRYSSSVNRINNGCPMYDADLDWARDTLVPWLKRSLAVVAGANKADLLDLSDAFQGHEVCSTSTSLVDRAHPPSGSQSDWGRFFNTGVLQGDLKESVHPNAFGQMALGNCLNKLWGTPVLPNGGMWKCTPTPGGSHDSMIIRPPLR